MSQKGQKGGGEGKDDGAVTDKYFETQQFNKEGSIKLMDHLVI